jgi:hypothetical protein
MRTRITLPIAGAALILAACSGADDGTGDIDLGTSEQPDDAAPDATGDTDADADAADDSEAATDTDTDPDTGEAERLATDDPAADGLVDLTEAIPGTWPVGDAGTVTFSIADGALVLDDVSANDGWRADIDEQDADEIEVDFRQGDIAWEIEIELEDNGAILAIEIDQDIEDADTGSYDIGDAGTFAFSVEDGRLVLDDLNLEDGWTLVEQDEEADEIEFEITNGPRAFDVEIELESDGTIDIEIDYEIVGPVNG